MLSENVDSADKELTTEVIEQAFEKLFGAEGKGVRRFRHSGLRHVKLRSSVELIEQNPNKRSQWAALAKRGHCAAWAMRGIGTWHVSWTVRLRCSTRREGS